MRKLKLTELNRDHVDDYKAKPKLPITIVLDNIRSAHNVGSVFRTSDAYLIERIMLCGITATPPHKEITKTAIGATDSVKWQKFDNVSDCITELKAKGYEIIGVEQTDKSIFLQNYQIEPNKRYALILGNEVNGISNEIVEHLDAAIELPQFGTKHSLNVSVCAGILIYEFWKGLKKA